MAADSNESECSSNWTLVFFHFFNEKVLEKSVFCWEDYGPLPGETFLSQKNPFCLMLKTIFKKLLYCCEVFKLFPKATIYVILQLTIFFDIQWPKFWILFAWTSNVDPMLRLLQVEMVGGFVRVDDDKRSSLMCKLEWTQIIVIPCWFAFYFLFRYANLT